MSILQSILDYNNDQEFSTALKTIPLEPLLNLLQISDVDSGAFDLRQTDSPPPYPPSNPDRPRHRKRSTCSQSSYDDRPREMSPIVGTKGSIQRHNSGASDARSDVWQHGGYMMQKKNSICSMGSSVDGDHSFPLYRYVTFSFSLMRCGFCFLRLEEAEDRGFRFLDWRSLGTGGTGDL